MTQTEASSIVAPNATLQKLSSQFKFTEGPAVNQAGVVYFTDQPNDKIWTYNPDGTFSLFMDKTGRSNGMYFDRQGNLITCADEKNELWSIGPDKKVTVLLADFNGHRFNGPNDLWIDPKGGIYFTDPYYQRDYWERKKPELDGEKVYYLPKGARQAILVDSDLKQPNGIIGTPDGKVLYVADIRDNKTYRYDIQADGMLKNRQLYVSQGSDGMTLDNKGNLYLTGKGVTVYGPDRSKLMTIPVPAGWVGNICFAGKNNDMLFITASESVYTLQMQVRGAR
ncbi:SMP-30/gluconolactonase/LRE family protein [Spirosoma sp. 209]|uniref:SMP-30/gluconolactonase/LRE family protein n=1 Tax=Spirosoma sp. 209 TaxID=1955701 RepID=UPI001F3DC8C3|nr:SMP-30/gluconolactonase/LRE family protein [Spirosoma sp. 209]